MEKNKTNNLTEGKNFYFQSNNIYYYNQKSNADYVRERSRYKFNNYKSKNILDKTYNVTF